MITRWRRVALATAIVALGATGASAAVKYLHDFSAASGLADTDNTFWCQVSGGCTGSDSLKRISMAQLWQYVVSKVSGDVSINSSGVGTLANTAVTPGTYGDATHVGQVTIDSKGRATSASNIGISGSAGGTVDTVKDGSTTVTSPGTVNFTSGCTVTNSAGNANVACSGGSSGISGLTTGQVPLAGSSTTLTSSFALGTGVQTALGVNLGTAGAFAKNNGDALSGTFTGTPTFSGALTFSGVPKYTGLSTGTIAAGKNLGLDASNNLVFNTVAGGGTIASTTSALAGDGAGNAVAVTGTGTNCVFVNGSSGACGGGGATGGGVDGGTSAQSLTAGAALSAGTRLVKIASGWASGTVTLQAISAVSSDTEVCIVDAGNFVDSTHTVSVIANAADTINTSASAVGPFTLPGFGLCVRVSATHNWTVESDEQSTIIQSVTGTGTLNSLTRVVKVASGWATGTLTLPAISAGMYDVCIRFNDGGNFVDGTHTLTIKGNTSDGINGGAANGTIGPFTNAGSFLFACVSAANNWNVGPGSVATSSASSTQIVAGIDLNGLTYSTVVAAVKTFWATPSSANLRSALSDETGTGLAYFQGGDIGTPSAGVGANITGIPNNNVLAASFAAGGNASLSGPREYYVCTGTCTITVPVPAAGNEFCVMNDDNVATVITLAALGSSARYEATARTSYGTAGTGTFVSGGAAGDKVCLLGRDSTHYLTVSFNGTWAAN